MSDYLQNTNVGKFNTRNLGAVAGTTNTFTTTVASEGSIDGRFTTALAVLTNSATTPTTDANTSAAFIALTSTTAAGGQACTFVFGVNAAGTLVAAQGPITATLLGVTTTPGAFIATPQFPALPDDFCPFAYTVARTSPTGNSITLGTTSWAASGVTFTTFRNIQQLPTRPQLS